MPFDGTAFCLQKQTASCEKFVNFTTKLSFTFPCVPYIIEVKGKVNDYG